MIRGHVDFSYEVSRSLATCEGALLVVDAGQGVEAQSVANCYTAIEQGLEVLPILNKMDLPQAELSVYKTIEEIIGIEASEAVPVSAKTGMGIEDALEYPVEHTCAGRPGKAAASTHHRLLVRQLLRGCFAGSREAGHAQEA